MRQTFVIHNATIVNEGRSFVGYIVVEDDHIAAVAEGCLPHAQYSDVEQIDASGCYLLPGIIDGHVHFREPGLTAKADFGSESRAAASGGVTSVLDMPNTLPETTTTEALELKKQLAQEKCIVNYGFFFGASKQNADCLADLPTDQIAGIKLFFGSSTGNMQIEDLPIQEKVFKNSPIGIVAHCEDSSVIRHNMAQFQALYGDDPDVRFHADIRSAESCYKSTQQAIALARRYQKPLHVAHISTANELSLFTPDDSLVSAEACVPHLMFSSDDYARLGSRIKCNPSIKTSHDREALRKALSNGLIRTIATDHAPHTIVDKRGGAKVAKSGMPTLQFSLVSMLELVSKQVLSIERMVELMCHNPARLYGIMQRGFLRVGQKADMVLVRPDTCWTVTPNKIWSKCNWSPFEGHTFHWRVERTFCNGASVYRHDTQTFLSGESQSLVFDHSSLNHQ
ncbi:MAG: dihydroorotase [Alloprevotella sp.]|nr:dihydroorotase [Alloprevotella sp.]